MRSNCSKRLSILIALVMVFTIQVPGIAFAEDVDGVIYVDSNLPNEEVDATHVQTIQDAVAAATPGAVVNVAAGTYTEGKIEIDKDLTMIGADKDSTIIKPSGDITGTPHTDNAGWFVVKAGNEFNLSNVTMDGEGMSISTAIMSRGSGVIDSNIIKNIYGGHIYHGIGIELYDSDMTVSNNSFSNIQRIGVFVGYNTAATTATIEGNTYQGKGTGDHLDYAFEVGRGGHAVITGNTITGNRGIAGTDSSSSAGIQVTSYFEPGKPAHATITDNTISDCTIGVLVGYDSGDGSVVTVTGNNLTENDIGIKSTAPTVNGKRNWWGTSTVADIQAKISGDVDYEPFYTSDAKSDMAYAYKVVNETKEISHETIQGAIAAADDGDTINVAAGTYTEGKIEIDKDLSITGADKDSTIIKPSGDITGTPHTDNAGWFVVKAGNEFNLSNVTLDGEGKNISTAIMSRGSGVIDSNIIKNIYGGHLYHGIGIELYDSDMTVSNNSFSNIQRIGVFVGYNTAATAATIEDNTYQGKGTGDHLDYAFEVGRGGHAVITGNTITGNRGITSTDSSSSAGIQVTSYYEPGAPSHADVEGNTISDCTIGVLVGYDSGDGSVVTVTGNNLTENDIGIKSTAPAVNGKKNWWGVSTSAEILTKISGNVSFDPWFSSAEMNLMASDKPVINETKVDSYDAIQAAIDAASAGDTILVSAGTYREDVSINKNGLKLKGTGAANTKIVATNAIKYPLSFSANNATAEGFTLTHAYTDAELAAWDFNNNGVTFHQSTSGNTLQNCTVTLNRNGIYLNNTQNNTIINNTITNNRTGINMTNNYNGTVISGNTISDNWTVGLVTYSLGGSTNLDTVSVTGNTFDNNWYSEILVKDAIAFTGTLDVSGNTFTDSPVTYSTSADPSLNEPGWADQKPAVAGITGGEANKPSKDLPTLRIFNSGTVLLKYDGPKTFSVGAGEYPTIQAAINAASAGDTVQVAEGTYEEKLNITKGVSIIGAGRDKVTIDATTFPAYGITVASDDVTLKGFTLQGSTSNSGSRYGIHVGSGGHKNINISDLKVQNFYRTGIDINGANGVTVSNVAAVDNGGNGIQTCDARNVTFSGITTSGNAWGGIGIFTFGRYSPIGTDSIVITGVNSFGESATSNGAIYLEEGNYGDPTKPHPITFSADPADNANVTFLSDDFLYMLSGNSDVKEKYKRFYPTLEQVLSAANGNPGHITTERYIRSLSDGSFYVPAGLAIQAAINAASAGDIIRVDAGTYNEALNINKSVELRGAQYAVDARNRAASESTITGGIVSITSAGAIIDGFTFAPPVWEGRIAPDADNITIKNNIIERAIYHTRDPKKAIENFTLNRNWFKKISGGKSAIVMEGATEGLTINDNLFTDISYSAIILGATAYEDTVISGNAIYHTESQAINLGGDHRNTVVSNNYIERANMSLEQDKGGIRIYGTDFTGPVNITGNTVVNSFNGFCVRDGGNITGKEITVRNNSFTGNSNAGVYNGAALGAINAENNYWGSAGPDVSGNVTSFPWYVDAGKTRLANQGYHLTSPDKSSTDVRLSWTGITGADGYNIYNAGSKVNSSVITGTTYTVTGLAPSTAYSFSLKVVIDRIEYAINDSAISVITNASGGDGGGGGGGTPPQTPPTPPSAPAELTDLKTEADKTLSDTLKATGQASLDLADTGNASAGLSTNVITQLAQENAPLIIKNTGIQVNFAPKSLITPELTTALSQTDAIVEIGAKQVSEEEKQDILASAPLGESTGIFEVGGVIVDLSANITSGGDASTKIENFSEPVAVTIDLSGLTLTPEQISELSGVRFEKDEAGNIVPVPLGGSYDPVDKTFTFYTTRFSLYSVLQVKDLVKLELTIGNQVSSVNGTEKKIDVPPSIVNGRTMVPLRFIGEAMGAEFEWDGKTRSVTFKLDGKEINLVIDRLEPGMDVPAIIVNNRTLVPVRYLTETFGAQVTWFPTEKKVLIVN